MESNETKALCIKTESLILRDFEEKDLEVFLQYRSDAELCKLQDFMVHSKEEALQFIKDQQNVQLGDQKHWKQLAIVDRTDVLLGDCAFKCNEYQSRLAEVGVTIRTAYHNQGIAREALSALFVYVFKEHDIHKITAIVDIRNIASQRLFAKLKFKKEAHFKKHYWDANDKEWFDEYHYTMLKEDF